MSQNNIVSEKSINSRFDQDILLIPFAPSWDIQVNAENKSVLLTPVDLLLGS